MQVLATRRPELAPAGRMQVVALRAGEPIGTWGFDKEVVSIGRSKSADISIHDEDNKKISRVHCTLEARADGLYVKDANSVNGTWLNGRRISEARVMPEDLVVVAGIRFRVILKERAERADEATPVDENSVAISIAKQINRMPNTVDFDKTAPELRLLDAILDSVEPEVRVPVVATPVREREAQMPARAPALTVGGKRRERSAPRRETSPSAVASSDRPKSSSAGMIKVVASVVIVNGALALAMVASGAAVYFLLPLL